MWRRAQVNTIFLASAGGGHASNSDCAAAVPPGGAVGVPGARESVGRAASGDAPLVTVLSVGGEAAGSGAGGAAAGSSHGAAAGGGHGDGAAGGTAAGQSSAQQQELFIRRKYHERAFTAASPLLPAERSAALHAAVRGSNVAAVLDLIAQNADVNREAEQEAGITPLMQAVRADNIPAVELLLQNRAEVGKRDGKGRTCLHHAAMLDHGQCTQVLLAHGASADARDDLGETALELAAHAPRAQAFEAIVRSKGLRMGSTGGFPGSGSDPEDNANSPRSASPPMVKGPSSPEPQLLPRTDDVAAAGLLHQQGLKAVPATGARLKSSLQGGALAAAEGKRSSGHRRGLSWSGWSAAGRRGSAALAALDGAKVLERSGEAPLVSAAPLSSDAAVIASIVGAASGGLDSDVELVSGREGDGGGGSGVGGGGGERQGGASTKKPSRMRGLGSLMRGIEHLKGASFPSKPTHLQDPAAAAAAGGGSGAGVGGAGNVAGE